MVRERRGAAKQPTVDVLGLSETTQLALARFTEAESARGFGILDTNRLKRD